MGEFGGGTAFGIIREVVRFILTEYGTVGSHGGHAHAIFYEMVRIAVCVSTFEKENKKKIKKKHNLVGSK